MKMKFWLYVSFFVVFTFVFSQIAFPLSAKVKSIKIKHAESAESLPVFNAIRNNAVSTQNTTYEYFIKDAALKDVNDHHFIEYEVCVESTRIIPIDILNSKITVNDKYKNRIIVKAAEPYEKEVSAIKSSNKKFKLLVDTSGMSLEEIHEMVKNIGIHVTWKAMPGWERENKVYSHQK